MEHGTITAILGSSVGLAGLLLVFVGFVLSRVETFDRVQKQRTYRKIARLGIIPFLMALLSAGLCLGWILLPSVDLYAIVIYSFSFSLILTAVYGVVAFLVYL